MNSIKKATLVLFFILGGIAITQAQVRDKVKTLKVAFITDELQLTTKEAQAFWPIYNEYEAAMEDIRKKERMQFGGGLASAATLSEAEASELLSSFQSLQQEKHSAQLVLIKKLKEVIPNKKIVLLLRAEEAFKRRLLQQYRKNRSQN